MKLYEALIIGLAAFVVVFVIGSYFVIAYVAFHFLSKWW